MAKGQHRNSSAAGTDRQRDIIRIPPRRTFLRLVLIMNSLARCGAGWGSRGRMTMLLSKGSPGTI